jgi:hypothetical protein
MAIKITNAALIAAGKELLTKAKQSTIPYVAGGVTLQGMDCQGLVEYLLMQCDIPKADCNLAGSNAHYRACTWVGTPEECKKAFGTIPGGAVLFILEPSGGEPTKYQADGIGNASHMGIWLGDTSMAASASRGQVIESNFSGKSISGGWNRVGLLPWVDYGLSRLQQALLTGDATNIGSSMESAQEASTGDKTPDVSQFYTVMKGCKGGAVERLQTWLSDLGYIVTVDHDFGPSTEATVKVFQRDHGLTIDGVVGKKTWAALAEARLAALESAQG